MTIAPNSEGDYLPLKYRAHEALQILEALWPGAESRIGWSHVAGMVFVVVGDKRFDGNTFNEAIEKAKKELP